MLVGVPSAARAASVLTMRSSRTTARRAGALTLDAAFRAPLVSTRGAEVIIERGLDRARIDTNTCCSPRKT